MAILTEQALREKYRNDKSKVIYVESGTKLTPSAKEFINDKGIEIIEKENDEKLPDTNTQKLEHKEEKDKINYPYEFLGTGARFQTKPEPMTSLTGNKLVYKNNPRIAFRGLVDSLEAEMLYSIALLKDKGNKEVLSGMEQLYEYTRVLLRAEVLGEVMPDLKISNLDSDQIREYSHKPKKYFGVDHFIMKGDESMELMLLNRLRAKVRELEVHSITPFALTKGEERDDILKAINRMSSGFYYLMLLSKSLEKTKK